MWEVFFSDGSSISSEDATPFSIEHREDVQVIIQPNNKHVWVTVSGADYYYWEDKGKGAKWWPCNDRSGLDHYLRRPGYKCVLFGSWIEPEDFTKVFELARSKFGEKPSFNNVERKP